MPYRLLINSCVWYILVLQHTATYSRGQQCYSSHSATWRSNCEGTCTVDASDCSHFFRHYAIIDCGHTHLFNTAMNSATMGHHVLDRDHWTAYLPVSMGWGVSWSSPAWTIVGSRWEADANQTDLWRLGTASMVWKSLRFWQSRADTHPISIHPAYEVAVRHPQKSAAWSLTRWSSPKLGWF